MYVGEKISNQICVGVGFILQKIGVLTGLLGSLYMVAYKTIRVPLAEMILGTTLGTTC